MKKVAVIMGSEGDFDCLRPAINRLSAFGVEFEVRVMSAHRTPQEACSFAQNAAQNGFGVIIAAAGKAAHLAGALAAQTVLPVIGIPVGASLMGLDSLLATVQMPSGVPVATVAVDGAENAAILAVQILGVYDEELSKKLYEFKKELRRKSIAGDVAIQEKLKN